MGFGFIISIELVQSLRCVRHGVWVALNKQTTTRERAHASWGMEDKQ